MLHDENDESARPLMQADVVPEDAETEAADADSDGATTATAKQSNAFIWLLTLTACLSGLLFGYDTGIISSTLLSLHTSLGHEPTTWDLSAITSSTSLAALLASPTAGWLADAWGRKAVIGVSCGGFVLGAFIQAGAGNVAAMVAGRAVVGAAVGAASGVVPLYISEIAPPSRRGRLVTVQSLFITFGQVLAYIAGWLVRGHWRWSVGLGAVPAMIQAVLLVSLPESPRWLILRSQDSAAREIFLRLGQSPHEAASIIDGIRSETKNEELADVGGKLKELLTVPANRKALGVACGLQCLQQLCGFNSLMYFSATIFSLVGFTSPVGVSLCVALTNFVFTLFAFGVIDRIGRRRVLLLSIPFMALGLGLCSLAFAHIDTQAGSSGTDPHPTSVWPRLLVAATILYVAAYATGLGCVPWQQAELFRLSVRSVGSGLATATNWSSNFLVGASFLPMMGHLGPGVTFAVYAGVCAAGWAWVWGVYPEVGGRALESTDAAEDEGTQRHDQERL